MKQINEYINESYLGAFKEKIKYSKSDWNKWIKLIEKEEWGNDIFIGNYESAPELTVVYKINDKDHTMDHIASYDNKKEILFCDDINLFGNEI